MQVADIKLASNGRTIAAGLGQNGITWTDVTRGALNNGDWLSVNADASGQRWVASTQSGQIFYADTSAANWKWTQVGTLGQGTRVAISADGTALVAAASGKNGGVWMSDDLGASWVQAAGRGEMGVRKGGDWVGATIDGATGMVTALAENQAILRFAAPSASAALNLRLPDTLMVAGDEATPLTFPAGSLYDADLLKTPVAGDNTPNVSVQFEVTQGAFGVSGEDATRWGVSYSATASGVKLSGTVAKLSSFLAEVGNLQFMPGQKGIAGPLVVTLSDGVNTVVREVPLVVQKPVALKASYNAGNFEILATSGNALRLNRSLLDEVRLGLLADELTVVRLADAPLVVRASEGADQITMDLGNTVATDGLPRTLRLEDVDSGPSEMRDDTLSLRFKPVASSTTKNVVTLANGKLVSGIENIVWDQTLGTLRLSGDSIVIKAEGDAPIDLGDTRLVIDAKTLVIEGDLRIKDASRIALNITEKITLSGIKLYGVNGAADTNLAVASVLSKDAKGVVQAQVVQSVKLAIPQGGGAVDLSAYVTPGAGLQITPEAGVSISLGGKGDGLALDPSNVKGDTTLVIGSSGGSNPVSMGGGESELIVSVPLTIQSSGVGGKVEVAGAIKGKKLAIFGPGNTTVFADGTLLAMTQGTEINDAVRFDGTVTLNMGDAATDQAGDFRVTGRLSGSTGNADVLNLSAFKGTIAIDGRVGDGIGYTGSTTILSGGEKYVDGFYSSVVLLNGNGSGATANITVAGGVVTQVIIDSVGGGYQVGDELTAARSSLGDLQGVASGFKLRVDNLSDLEGLTVSAAMNVTFGERVYVDGNITINATGKVVFSDQVVLRNGGQLIINGTQDIQFMNGIRFDADAKGHAGKLQISSADTSVSFLSGLFAGKNDAMSWSGVTSLELKAAQTSSEKGSLSVTGTNLVFSEAPGFTNLNLNLDALTLRATSLTMPASKGVTVNMDLGVLDISATAGIGSSTSLLKVNADKIVAHSTAGDVYIEVTSSDSVKLDVQTRANGAAHIGATQDLKMSSDSVIDAKNLTLSAQRNLQFSSSATGAALTLNAGGNIQMASTAKTLSATAGGSVTMGATSVTNDLTVTSGAGLSLSGGLNVGGTATLRAVQAVDMGSVSAASGLNVVSTAGSITLHQQPITSQLKLNAATGIGLDSGIILTASSIDLSASTDLGSVAVPLSLSTDKLVLNSTQGNVFIRLVTAGPLSAQVMGNGKVSVVRTGALSLVSGSSFTSSTDSITLNATQDMLISGVSFSAAKALIESGQASVTMGATSATNDLTVTSGAGLSLSGGLNVGGTATLRAVQAVDMGSVSAASGLNVVSTAGSITLHQQPITSQLKLNAATGIGLDSGIILTASSIDLSASTDLGSVAVPLSLSTDKLVLNSTQGNVFIRLVTAGPLSAQVMGNGKVSVVRTGALSLVSGSSFTSSTDSITLNATQDMLISGVSFSAAKALIESGGAIRAVALENAPATSISGELHLDAMTGIGGFGYGRVLVNALNPRVSVSAYNHQSGDVVIAGLNGLTISADGIKSDSDGWVALLGGTGSISEQGQVVARSTNVVRVTGVNWMRHPEPTARDIMEIIIDKKLNPNNYTMRDAAAAQIKDEIRADQAISTLLYASSDSPSGAVPPPKVSAMAAKKVANNLVLDTLRNGAISFTSGSPLERMNQSLAQSWTVIVEQASTEASLTTTEKIVAANTYTTLGVESTSAFMHGGSMVINSPQTTSQLLEMAMTLTQQGRQSAMSDTENLTSWVNRTVPTDTPSQTLIASRSNQPASPSTTQENASVPAGAVDIRTLVEGPASPRGTGTAIAETPTDAPISASISDVRWLLPASHLQSGSESAEIQASQPDLLSSTPALE